MPRKVIPAAVDIIKRRESLKLVAYLCPAGIPTIGYGHTRGVTHEDVQNGRRCTKAQAEKWLREDIAESAEDVANLVADATGPTSDEEFGAMVSLHFNIGPGWSGRKKPRGAKDGFRQSSVLRHHLAGNRAAAARAFGLWNKATNADGVKVELRGLTLRRAEEAALYLTPSAELEAVDPIRTRAADTTSAAAEAPAVTPTNAGVTLAGAGTVMQMATEAIQQAEPAIPLLQTALTYAPWVVGLIVIAGIGLVVWHQVQKRREAM